MLSSRSKVLVQAHNIQYAHIFQQYVLLVHISYTYISCTYMYRGVTTQDNISAQNNILILYLCEFPSSWEIR